MILSVVTKTYWCDIKEFDLWRIRVNIGLYCVQLLLL